MHADVLSVMQYRWQRLRYENHDDAILVNNEENALLER
jgi:hypothetical protein